MIFNPLHVDSLLNLKQGIYFAEQGIRMPEQGMTGKLLIGQIQKPPSEERS
jgi:hypothetical protein